ncbi:MAG: hypothetical protein NTV49_12820 [Kiritimatiellaeota bacterium]|nr:hypothetical protein [Kiritimatiellota bacterium]
MSGAEVVEQGRQATGGPSPQLGMKTKTLSAVLVMLFLAGLLSLYRENIIPCHGSREQIQWLLTGDEPSYLLTALALAHGDGLNVRPVHEAGAYRRFQDGLVIEQPDRFVWKYYYGDWLKPRIDRSAQWGNAQIFTFPPLIPALIAPFIYRTDQIRWWTAVGQGFLLCSAGFFLIMIFPAGDRVRLWTWCGCVLWGLGLLPVGYYTTAIFPETVTGCLLLLFLYLQGHPSSGLRCVSLVVLVTTLFATPRILLGVGAASAYLLARGVARKQWLEMLLLACGWIIYFGFNLSLWGAWLPAAGNSFLSRMALPTLFSSSSVLVIFPQGLLRCFFANDIGLLLLNPFFMVGVVAMIYVCCHLRTADTWLWLLLFGGIIFSVAIYQDYRAGTCPMGRYQVIPAYLLCFMIFEMVRACPVIWLYRMQGAMIVLGGAGLLVALLVAVHPNFWFRDYHPLFGYEALQAYYRFLPDFGPGKHWLRKCVAYGLAFLLPFFFGDIQRYLTAYLVRRTPPVPR